MEINSRRQPAIAILDKEFLFLETVSRLGPCTSEQVQKNMDDKADLLTVMRKLHILVDRGLLMRTTSNGKTLYWVKANYKTMRSRLIVMESI